MRECFVIMPIGSGDAYQVYRNRYEHIIQPAVEGLRDGDEQVFRCVRADFVTQTGSITRDLIRRLHRSDTVIADLTDLNANVFYELGVRHALRAGTILIAVKGTKPPFDVGDLRIIHYDDRVGGEKEAIPQIQSMLKSMVTEERQQDSPVLLAIPELGELGASKELEARITALQREKEVLTMQLQISERSALVNQASLAAMHTAIERLTERFSDSQRKATEEKIQLLVEAEQAPVLGGRVVFRDDLASDLESVFVLMPTGTHWDRSIYDAVGHAAREAGLRTHRADMMVSAGPIIDQIFESIAKSGLVLADLTNRNPNVMYELGLAMAMKKKTLLIAQEIGDVPFDVRHQRVLLYRVGAIDALVHQLLGAFRLHRAEQAASLASAKLPP